MGRLSELWRRIWPAEVPGKVRRRMLRGLTYVAARAPWAWRLGIFSGVMRVVFDVAAPRWNDLLESHRATWSVPLEAGLQELREEPQQALDVGTGTGLAAALIARQFPHATVTGVDVSPQMIARARERSGHLQNLRFQVADARRLPFKDGSFQLVTALNVPIFAAELARVTALGGWVLICFTFGEETPIYLPTPELERLLASHGFREIRTGRAGEGVWTLARRA